ncbi:formimidoyltetrahydrofolate cyclodeaminase [Halobellus sp. Atlit-31R]|nr:formimidoyltetrahydrofolate cyclodeaminase [Halobellus sp. Atlit-31R]
MQPTDRPLGEFLDDIASEQVAPAGGSVIATTGAMGAALCEMVCVHTIAAGDAETSTATLGDLREDLERRRRSLLALADRDAAVVEELFGARRGQPSARLAKRATGVPLAIAEACLHVLEDADRVIDLGAGGVVADARIGASLADSALRASLWMVRANLDTLAESSFAAEVADRAAAVERAAADLSVSLGNPTG